MLSSADRRFSAMATRSVRRRAIVSGRNEWYLSWYLFCREVQCVANNATFACWSITLTELQCLCCGRFYIKLADALHYFFSSESADSPQQLVGKKVR